MLGNLDLTIFKSGTSTCGPHSKSTAITDRCSHLKRLCVASRYYDALSTGKVGEEMRKRAFIEFNEEVYHSLIDDVGHLLSAHSDDVMAVHREWVEEYGFPNCSVSECAKTDRHYLRGHRERKKASSSDHEQDALYSFYEALFDRVHNFVAHLFDIGLRVDTASLIDEMGRDQKEDVLDGLTVDALFAAERDQIRMKRKECKLDLDRLDAENNKFTITQNVDGAVKGQITLMDALCERLLNDKETTKRLLLRFRQFLDRNGYDSECLEMDIEDEADSNICRVIESETAVQIIKTLIRSTKCMHSLSVFMLCHLQRDCIHSESGLNSNHNHFSLDGESPWSLALRLTILVHFWFLTVFSVSLCVFDRIRLRLLEQRASV